MATQTGYKASELGMIPQNWDVVELGDVFEVTAGGDLDVTNFSTEKTHKHIYPVYSNAITDNGLYGFSSSYDCCGNHITVTARGYIGYAVPRNGKFSSIGRLLTLKPKTEISCYLVAQYINQFVSFAIESTGVPQLTAPQIKKYLVAIPKSTIEQTAIATALSDTDALISSLQTLIAKKQAIKLSAMQNLLSGKIRLPEFTQRPDGSPQTMHQTELGLLPEDWEVVELGSVAEIQRGASPRPIDAPIWFSQSSNVGWLRISDVTKSEKYLYNTIQNLSEEGIKNSRYVAKDNLIMSICATVGKPIINRKDICIHDGFVVFGNPKFDIEFMFYVLQEYESKWVNQGQTGSQMNLNTDLIKNKTVCLPPHPEQTAIAQLLSDMDAEIIALEGRLKKTQSLKQGMMQALLTGKIRLPLE